MPESPGMCDLDFAQSATPQEFESELKVSQKEEVKAAEDYAALKQARTAPNAPTPRPQSFAGNRGDVSWRWAGAEAPLQALTLALRIAQGPSAPLR